MKMIEEIVFNYLKNKLNVPVTFENINEVEYVLIGKSGSSRFDFTNTATFLFNRIRLQNIKHLYSTKK